MTSKEYWYWLCNIPDIYPESIRRLLSVYDSAEEIYHTDIKELEKRGLLSEKQIQSMIQTRNIQNYSEQMEKMEREGIRFIAPDSSEYPERLRKIADPPSGLYVRGNLPKEDCPTAGMVGARICSEYGKQMAKKFGRELSVQGIQIISGMASGVDSISARGALDAGKPTFAVLGSGVDVIYPVENVNLYYEILMNGGGIISEYPLGTQPNPWQFPYRNRLISGLSDCLLVMEARKRSGTLVTVRYALEQGKDVYALPGRITDATSEGCNQMIADGAGILISPEAFCAEFFQLPLDQFTESSGRHSDLQLESSLKKIYEMIGSGPVTTQFIIEKSRQNPEKITAFLTELELSGLIKEVAQNTYVREV